MRSMVAKFSGSCAVCGGDIKVGESVLWAGTGTVIHDIEACRADADDMAWVFKHDRTGDHKTAISKARMDSLYAMQKAENEHQVIENGKARFVRDITAEQAYDIKRKTFLAAIRVLRSTLGGMND